MPKNLVLCCDGTANEFAEDKTNVIKLYSTLVEDPTKQVVYYHPGIGTMEHPGSVTNVGRKVTKLLGLAIGFGLENDIRDAYVFLMQNFQPGDNIYLFGFSRGAYTVRALAGMLKMYGLIRPGHEAMIPYAIRMLTSVSSNKKDADKRAKAAFDLAWQFKSTFCSVECHTYFLGVWDTVSSVGWIQNPLRVPYTASNPEVAIGRHAIAIDEHRAFFRTNLWRRAEKPAPGQQQIQDGPVDQEQVWFAGVHCDIGGGYAETESGLSKIALEWMLFEAMKAGMHVDDARVKEVLGRTDSKKYIRKDPMGCIHKSLSVAWYPAEFVLKRHYNFEKKKNGWRMNLFRRRTIPPGSKIHEAAFARGEKYIKQLPKDAVKVRTVPPPGWEEN